MLNNINISQYPRNSSEKRYTDLVILTFLIQKFFRKINRIS